MMTNDDDGRAGYEWQQFMEEREQWENDEQAQQEYLMWLSDLARSQEVTFNSSTTT